MFPEFRNRKTELTENGNFRLFAAKGKQKTSIFLLQMEVYFLGRETINSNRQLLFQQTCPSMHIRKCCVASRA
jgi:hypothetical protein